MPLPPEYQNQNKTNRFEERMRTQQNALSTPYACERCGATYFTDAHAHQYSRAGYGTIEFRQLTVSPVPVKICVGCSLVIPPKPQGGKMHPASTPDFQASVKAGENYRSRIEITAESVVSLREFKELQTKLEALAAKAGVSMEVPAPTPPAIVEASTPDPLPTVEFVDEAPKETMSSVMAKRTGKQKRKVSD
jgi:hypothetical protein